MPVLPSPCRWYNHFIEPMLAEMHSKFPLFPSFEVLHPPVEVCSLGSGLLNMACYEAFSTCLGLTHSSSQPFFQSFSMDDAVIPLPGARKHIVLLGRFFAGRQSKVSYCSASHATLAHYPVGMLLRTGFGGQES